MVQHYEYFKEPFIWSFNFLKTVIRPILQSFLVSKCMSMRALRQGCFISISVIKTELKSLVHVLELISTVCLSESVDKIHFTLNQKCLAFFIN